MPGFLCYIFWYCYVISAKKSTPRGKNVELLGNPGINTMGWRNVDHDGMMIREIRCDGWNMVHYDLTHRNINGKKTYRLIDDHNGIWLTYGGWASEILHQLVDGLSPQNKSHYLQCFIVTNSCQLVQDFATIHSIIGIWVMNGDSTLQSEPKKMQIAVFPGGYRWWFPKNCMVSNVKFW